jgi:hypothetical protein
MAPTFLGPPIEIAWAVFAFELHAVISEVHLICPPDAWLPERAMDSSSAEPHGLLLSDLREFGSTPRVLAEHMNERLVQRELFTAGLDDDDCLTRLFDAATIVPQFARRRSDAEELIVELAQMRRLTHATFARARRQAEVMSPDGTRAEARARFLATLWAIIAQRN